VGNKRSTFLGGHSPRSVALLVLIAIPLGNLLCESGNLLAGWLGLRSHYFNAGFLAVGIAGILGFGIALLGRRNLGDNPPLGK